jgi:calcium-independent phospholipase A2-gamma
VNAKYWKAIRASTAAPGFFKEVRINVKGIRIANTEWDIHQDGGLIANNPAAVAIGECKALWPQHKIQSVVSIGTGRYEPVFGEIKETSIANKLDVIINSATNTHNVHSMMYETLENGVYFRFDPYLSESAAINVWQTDKIESLKMDARRYCYKNDDKFKECIGRLNKMTGLGKKWEGIGKF